MQILVWAGMFLLLAVVGSTVGVVGMIGLPIAFSIQVGVFAMATVVAVSGIALVALSPRTMARRNEMTDAGSVTLN